MPRRTLPPRSPAPDRGLSPIVTVFLLAVLAALVGVGLQLWLGLFTTPADGDVQVQTCDPDEDGVTLRLLDGGPVPYRALGLTLENHSADRTEVQVESVDLDGRWRDGRFLVLGTSDPNADNIPPDDWELASPGGLDNRSAYGLRIVKNDYPETGPLAVLDFHCR